MTVYSWRWPVVPLEAALEGGGPQVIMMASCAARHVRSRWLLTAAFMVVFGLHALSGPYQLQVVARTTPVLLVRVGGGRVTVIDFTRRSPLSGPAWSVRRRPRVEWWVWWDADNFAYSRGPTHTAFVFGLWPALVALGIPTCVLWRRHIQALRPGRCACGYPLLGLEPVDGTVTCPECGSRHAPVDSARA